MSPSVILISKILISTLFDQIVNKLDYKFLYSAKFISYECASY